MSQHDDGGITVVDVSDPAVRALPIPLWVPTAVARSIRTKYAKDLHELADLARDALAEEGRDYLVYVMELLLPVVCNPRMRGVWKQLYRPRSDGTFLYPASDAWWERRIRSLQPAGVPSAADASERQDEAM